MKIVIIRTRQGRELHLVPLSGEGPSLPTGRVHPTLREAVDDIKSMSGWVYDPTHNGWVRPA